MVLKAGTSFLLGQRVKIDTDGFPALAGTDELGIGVMCADAVAGTGTSGTVAAIDLFNEGGVKAVTASNSITSGDKVEIAASGAVKLLDGGTAVGVAISGASALDTVRVIFY
jgi:hypothetical protein